MFTVVSENTRATDKDRNDTCQALDAALEDGQLSTEEHRQRVSSATKATTLSQLRALVSDLQIRPAEAATPAPVNKRRVVLGLVALAVVAAGIQLAWGLSGNDSPSTPPTSQPTSSPSVATTVSSASPTSTPAAPPQLLTLSGVTGVLAQMRTQFGDTLGYQFTIYEDKAIVLRPDTANAHMVVRWMLLGGSWTKLGPTTAISGSAVGDLGKFDVQAVIGVVHDASQTLQLYDAPQTFLTIESRKDGSLYISIHVSDNTRRSGWIVVSPDGGVIEINRPTR